MIIKCTSNTTDILPLLIQNYAWTQGKEDTQVDLTTGKYYAVYAIINDDKGERYLVHTDNSNSLRWMPSEFYEVYEAAHPTGWKEWENKGLISYPALHNSTTFYEIIDNEDPGKSAYMAEVAKDSTFPSVHELGRLNYPAIYEQKLKLAKECGYEYPPKAYEDSNEYLEIANYC